MKVYIEDNPKNITYDKDSECYVIESNNIFNSDNITEYDEMPKFIKHLMKNFELDYNDYMEIANICLKNIKQLVEFKPHETCLINGTQKLLNDYKEDRYW